MRPARQMPLFADGPNPASLPKVAARGLVSNSMRSRQEPRKTYREFESHSLRHHLVESSSPPVSTRAFQACPASTLQRTSVLRQPA
jgi:hypothetical protein